MTDVRICASADVRNNEGNVTELMDIPPKQHKSFSVNKTAKN
jgi:hypothetical protein